MWSPAPYTIRKVSFVMMQIKCPQCGKDFKIEDSRPVTNKTLCCSQKCSHELRRIPEEVRFWKRVVKSDGCWTWIGAKTNEGYGTFFVYKLQEKIIASRASWMIAHGDIPEGKLVCHHCDNPACVRPDHLFLGSYTDNMRDARRKGRVAFGEDHSCAKLTEKQVREIISKKGIYTQKRIGKMYGVTQTMVSRIFRKVAWAHI